MVLTAITSCCTSPHRSRSSSPKSSSNKKDSRSYWNLKRLFPFIHNHDSGASTGVSPIGDDANEKCEKSGTLSSDSPNIHHFQSCHESMEKLSLKAKHTESSDNLFKPSKPPLPFGSESRQSSERPITQTSIRIPLSNHSGEPSTYALFREQSFTKANFPARNTTVYETAQRKNRSVSQHTAEIRTKLQTL